MAEIIVVVPAHNEASSISETLESLSMQTHAPREIVVVADNCTDDTAAIASKYARVIASVDNTDKKAGALNQALEQLLPTLQDDDCVLVMDADTTVDPDFIRNAVQLIEKDQRIGGVSSVFAGRSNANVLGLIQSMEFFRYQRQIRRNGDRAFVLSGTASVLRVSALRAVKAARGEQLPHGGGSFYDTSSLTEDNEMTLALLMLGYQCVAPGLISTTDVMPSMGKLYRQRHRWYLGALRNIGEYGRRMPWYMRWTYWRQQGGLAISLFAIVGYLILLCTMPSHYVMRIGLWTLVPLLILGLERVVTVWRMGWRARLVAALVIPEQLYAIFLTATYSAALKDFTLRRKGAWHTT